MNFKIQKRDEYFLLDYSDRVDLNSIISSYSTLLQNPEFKKDSHTLWNFTKSLLDLSLEDIHKIAEAVIAASQQRANTARSAFVVQDPSDKAILQTYITETARFPVEFKIFDNERDGVNWLKEV